jgi:thiamine-phosphate pyrophosphorylase
MSDKLPKVPIAPSSTAPFSAAPSSAARSVGGLYAITPDELPLDQLVPLVRGALAGGARVLQYRRKQTVGAARIDEARTLGALVHAHGAIFIVNDDLALAYEVGADGVHWGRDDADTSDDVALINQVREAKRLSTRRDFIIGLSCYNDIARAQRAARAGCDYIAFGAMFVSSTKPHAIPADATLFAAARSKGLNQPLVAIGGITRDNAASLIAQGADAIAVISDLFDAATPAECEARARTFSALFHHKANHV